jgi:cell division protein FtsZ
MNEACTLIAEAADPEANIIFGSVIDAHAGDEVRITVIATGFSAHMHEQPTPGSGRGSARGRDGQMALPMQSAGAMAQAPTMTMMAQQPMSPWGQTSSPTPRGGYAAPAPRPASADAGENIDLDQFYSSMAEVPPGAQPNGPEWTPSERQERPDRPERPIVRPQAPGAAPTAPLGRRSAQMQSPRPADELGVEESEFDKPTYLRRGLYAPE